MSLHVIAEGVESEQQNKILTELGCDFIQGYFHHRPMAMMDLSEHLFNKDRELVTEADGVEFLGGPKAPIGNVYPFVRS